jgi:hypothetical protein
MQGKIEIQNSCRWKLQIRSNYSTWRARTCNKQARIWGRYKGTRFNFLPKFSGVLTHDNLKVMIQSTETIYACLTWVKPANKHSKRRWEINLLEHKEKLLSPVTWNGFHSAYTSLSSRRKAADIRHQHRSILTRSPETSVDSDSAGSVYSTLIFIICSQTDTIFV